MISGGKVTSTVPSSSLPHTEHDEPRTQDAMTQKYEKLKTLLQELFQLDQPDLDFGLYRVMHAKSAEVSQFLDKDLLPQVHEAFGQYRTADKVEIEKELAKALEQAQALGADPETLPKVKDLRTRLANDAVDIGALESEVYDNLFSFFRRYYSEGDFLAKRVYKPGVYAIPYEGEEVTLHWANKDQYYIKTSEYLCDYAFRLRPEDDKKPMRVHFRLADAAEGEHGNVKAAEGKDRVFILSPPGKSGRDFIAEEDGEHGKELVIRFEYRPATLTDWPENARAGKSKPPAQKDLSALAAKRVLAMTDALLAAWIAELGKPHVTTSGEKADYMRLEAHLRRYTARNTFDYFIHKDLGTFLRRELDFYIKNEVMHLDDVENETAPRVEQYLSKIKVIRKIAGKIIVFLAQLENFQKKLWLKKKFVVETQWCMTVGCIPEAFYPEIATNKAQHDEWIKLFAIDEIEGDLTTPAYSKKLKPEFMKAHPTLVVDTRHFDASFTARLLDAIGDVNEQTDGLLFHSENFQALSGMQARYREQVKCSYIDPPYNSAATQILYKNDYLHSSWMSLMQDRLELSRLLLSETGVMQVAIDDTEFHRLEALVHIVFGEENHLANVAIMHNPKGRDQGHVATAHEYTIITARDSSSAVTFRLPLSSEALAKKFAKIEGEERYRELPLRRSGSGASRSDRPYMYYPFLYDQKRERLALVPKEEYERIYTGGRFDDALVESLRQKYTASGFLFILPIRDDDSPGRWRWGYETSYAGCNEGVLFAKAGRNPTVYQRDTADESFLPKSFWYGERYDASTKGTNLLRDIVGINTFDYPKSIFAVQDMITIGCGGSGSVLDSFAGSGTTGHAVINLNREDGGRRKFILVEMGEHFDAVLLPRIKKVTFTPEWKDGKPKRLATVEESERSPRIVKVVRLESYEDTLNNLDTRRSDKQQLLLSATEAQGADGLKEQYILRYMLDVETRGSNSLLNVQAFTDPTAYKLKVKRPGSDESREVNVDLLETFNWLIGLTVKHIAAPQTFSAAFERDSEKRLRLKSRLKLDVDGPYWFRTVIGTTPDGRKALIIWRKLTGDPEQDNLVLDEWFTKLGYSAKDSEFDLIYVNGGNNLENLKTPDNLWKVRLIEDDFHRLMFEVEGA